MRPASFSGPEPAVGCNDLNDWNGWDRIVALERLEPAVSWLRSLSNRDRDRLEVRQLSQVGQRTEECKDC